MVPVWASSAHLPRRSHEHTPSDLRQPPASTADDQREPRRRTSSDSTPRQTSANTRFLSSANEHDANKNILSSIASVGSDSIASARRLGFFADKISSSFSGGTASPHHKTSALSSQLLHPLSHSKPDSTSAIPTSNPSSSSFMNPSSSSTNLPKTHTSPSKVCSITCIPRPLTQHLYRAHMDVPMIQSLLVVKCIGWPPCYLPPLR